METDCKAVFGSLRASSGVMVGCLAALLIVGCASNLSKPPVTVEQIVEMGRQGVPADAIIERMKESGAVYQLPASRLAALGQMGVPGPVLDYMQQSRFRVASQQADEEYNFQTKMLGK